MKAKLFFTVCLLFGITMLKAQVIWNVYNTSNSGISSDSIDAVAIDASNNVWTGSSTRNILDKFTGTSWINNTDNLVTGGLGGFVFDSNGKLWFAGNGLNTYNGSAWTNYNIVNSGLPENSINSLAIDAHNNKWIGETSQGLVKYNDTTWTVYNSTNSGIPNDKIYCLAFNGNGDIWMGTHSSGIVKFNGTSWINYNTSNSSLPSNAVYAIAMDPSGNLWCGTYNGVAKFNGTIWTIYNTSNSSLPNNYIGCIAFSQFGNIWIGTRGGGLARLNSSGWTVYNTANSNLPNNNVWSLAVESNQQKICIGTLGGGLAILNLNDVGVHDINALSNNIKVYPNPASDMVTFDINNANLTDLTLNIYNVIGTLVKSETLKQNQRQINIGDLSNGVYMVTIRSKEFTENQKLIIQR